MRADVLPVRVDNHSMTNWPALLIIMVAFGMLLLTGASDWTALAVLTAGYTAGTALSDRDGWWWVGIAAVAVIWAGAVGFNWLGGTHYPVSDLTWNPFTTGADRSWDAFGFVTVTGVATAIVLNSRTPGAYLARVAAVMGLAVVYLFAGWSVVHPEGGAGPALLATALTLLVIGGADEVVGRFRLSRPELALPPVIFATTLVAAALFWRLWSAPPLVMIGTDPPTNNTAPMITFAVVCTIALILSSAAIRRARSRS